jgi:hypothetical protein
MRNISQSLVIVLFFFLLAGCVPLNTTPPIRATPIKDTKVLRGTWVGTWNASWGGSGPYTLEVESVENGDVAVTRSHPSRHSGSTYANGKIEQDVLVLDYDRGPDNLIRLRLYQENGSFLLRGEYSTQGRYYGTNERGVFTGTLELKKETGHDILTSR